MADCFESVSALVHSASAYVFLSRPPPFSLSDSLQFCTDLFDELSCNIIEALLLDWTLNIRMQAG